MSVVEQFQAEQKRQALTRLGILVVFVLLVVINIGGGQGWFCNASNADVSRLHPTPVTPAGYAFSIWGLIFFLQAAFAVSNVLCSAVSNRTIYLVGIPVSIGWVLEVVWTPLFDCSHLLWQAFAIVASFVVFAMAYALAFLLLPDVRHFLPPALADMGDTGGYEPEQEAAATGLWAWVPAFRNNDAESAADYTGGSKRATRLLLVNITELVLVYVPTSINCAWLLVASQIGVLVAISRDNVPGTMASDGWGIAAIVLSTLIGTAVGIVLRDPLFPGVVIWALAAILVEDLAGSDAIYWTGVVAVVLLSGALLFAVAMRVLQLLRVRRTASQSYETYAR